MRFAIYAIFTSCDTLLKCSIVFACLLFCKPDVSGQTVNSFEFVYGESINKTLYLDTASEDVGAYLEDQESFFDSLNVIPFDRAMKTAHRKRIKPKSLILIMSGDSTITNYWMVEGKPKCKLGGKGPGNTKCLKKTMMLNANTGKVLRIEKEKYRKLVDF